MSRKKSGMGKAAVVTLRLSPVAVAPREEVAMVWC
jgi:hypothetical protein